MKIEQSGAKLIQLLNYMIVLNQGMYSKMTVGWHSFCPAVRINRKKNI